MKIGKGKLLGCALGGMLVATAVFLVVLLLIKVLWAWTVPDLFPRAVAENYVAPAISWWTAAKIALVLAVLSGIVGGQRGS